MGADKRQILEIKVRAPKHSLQAGQICVRGSDENDSLGNDRFDFVCEFLGVVKSHEGNARGLCFFRGLTKLIINSCQIEKRVFNPPPWNQWSKIIQVVQQCLVPKFLEKVIGKK